MKRKNEEKRSLHIQTIDIQCGKKVKIIVKKIYLKKHEYILLRNESKDVIRLREANDRKRKDSK